MADAPKQRLSFWRWVMPLAILAALAWLALWGLPDGRLHVYFLDVGQGDAILVQTPDGRQILVDGGPSPTALLNEIGGVLPFWDRSLDLVVLTHPDDDHRAGLLPLLDRYRVGRILDTQTGASPAPTTAWQERLARGNVARTVALRGMRIPVGQVVLTVLNPGSEQLAGAASDSYGNNDSIVLRLDYGQTSLLLTGDAEAEAEADMLKAGLPLRADLLKVGHHGSKNSTSALFLAAVAPSLAVIQVGADNAFGLPSPEALKRLADARIEILRTDLRGRIEVVSDGRTLRVKTARQER